jgi:synaptosomal-associated protein 29
MSQKYISNANNLFVDDEDDVCDEEFLKNSRTTGNPFEQKSGNSAIEQQQMLFEQKKREIENRTLESSNRSLGEHCSTINLRVAHISIVKFFPGLLRETEQVGIATAEELAKQREQLENTSRNLDEINNTLRYSQKHLNGLKSIFGGLKNYLSGQKDYTPRMTASPSTESKIFEQQQQQQASAMTSEERYNSHPTTKLRDDFQQQQRKAPSFDQQLESNLDEMAGNLSRLKHLAIDMHQEIDSQNDLIDNIHDKVENVDIKIGKQSKEMNKLLGKK